MFLIKIKPLGWLIVLCALIGTAVTGAVLSKRIGKPASASAAIGDATIPAAASGDFAHVAATSPEVTAAIAADDLDAGEKKIDKKLVFTGTVKRIYVTNSKAMTFLNFADNYKDAFTVMIQSKDYGSFPDLNALEAKKVVVTGTATAYQGKLEIVATAPEQIKIVDETKSAP